MAEYSFVLEEFIPTQRYLLLRGLRRDRSERSKADDPGSTNIDMIFMGVEYIEAPMALGQTVDLVEPTNEELKKVNRILRNSIGTAIPASQLFALEAGGRRCLVAAHSMRVDENDLDYNESRMRDRFL